MTEFDRRKITETVLYILHKTGGVDYYHVFKILYFAAMKHLAKWGTRMVPDEFCALPYGPVPTRLYDAVKELGHPHMQLAEELSGVVCFAGNDAPDVLLPKRGYDETYLSKSEIEALDASIEENAHLTFTQLKQKSHDAAWREADRRVNGTNIISPLSMAKVINADEAMLEYIQGQLEVDMALS